MTTVRARVSAFGASARIRSPVPDSDRNSTIRALHGLRLRHQRIARDAGPSRGILEARIPESMSKRAYNRRTEDEKIEELQAKIADLRLRMELKNRKDGPVFRDLKKVKKVLTKFGQTAMDCERVDLATMTQAFLAGLERSAGAVGELQKRRGRAAKDEDDE